MKWIKAAEGNDEDEASRHENEKRKNKRWKGETAGEIELNIKHAIRRLNKKNKKMWILDDVGGKNRSKKKCVKKENNW